MKIFVFAAGCVAAKSPVPAAVARKAPPQPTTAEARPGLAADVAIASSSRSSADRRGAVLAPTLMMVRVHPAVVSSDGSVLVIGGENAEGALRSMEQLDEEGRRWNSEASMVMKVARVRHTATVLEEGQVLVAGGGGSDRDARLAELWDGERFVAAGRMQRARNRHTATRLTDGRVLVIGGRDPRGRLIRDAELWEPKTRTWRLAGTLNAARCCHTATLLDDGRVLVVAGQVSMRCVAQDADDGDADDGVGQGGPCYQSTNSVEVWDPASERFSPGPPLDDEYGRAAHTATRLLDGRVLVAGGAPAGHDDIDQDDTHHGDLLWDPGTNAWTLVELGLGAAYHTTTLLRDGTVVAIGGQSQTCGCCAPLMEGEPRKEFKSAIMRFDPKTNEWKRVGFSHEPRERHGAVPYGDGILVVGGASLDSSDGGRPLATTERWAP